MALAAVTLDDKYTLEQGRVYLTGTQALVRLPMIQRQRDVAAGLNTGCFISGYRGSPLGGFDQALWQARKFLAKNHIHFQPGVNEELGATAVWGSQQLGLIMTASSASGTARVPASTGRATSSSTPTRPAPRATAASWSWPATTMPASPRPSPTSPSRP
jgi:hypothetical protein